MREILFRGKTFRGEWITGLLAYDKSKDTDFPWFISNSAGRPFAYSVDSKTVGQFTGLLDKNGVKIFEGDILKLKEEAIFTEKFEEWIGVVEWSVWELCYKYGFYCWCSAGRAIGCNEGENIAHDHEVIGNIHDNPELLNAN